MGYRTCCTKKIVQQIHQTNRNFLTYDYQDVVQKTLYCVWHDYSFTTSLLPIEEAESKLNRHLLLCRHLSTRTVTHYDRSINQYNRPFVLHNIRHPVMSVARESIRPIYVDVLNDNHIQFIQFIQSFAVTIVQPTVAAAAAAATTAVLRSTPMLAAARLARCCLR